MKIEDIEDNIGKISDSNYVSIIELIIDAVRTYPLYELNDTEDYFKNVKKLLEVEDINLTELKNYLECNVDLYEENAMWISDSLNSLCEAFELMHLHKISFNEVKNAITRLK